MTKVWIVYGLFYDEAGSHVRGVFSSKEKAEKFVAEIHNTMFDYFHVDEMIVDGEVA